MKWSIRQSLAVLGAPVLIAASCTVAQAERVLVKDTHADVVSLSHDCQTSMDVEIKGDGQRALSLETIRKLARVAHASISLECRQYRQMQITAHNPQPHGESLHPLYRGHMSRATNWRLINDFVSSALIDNDASLAQAAPDPRPDFEQTDSVDPEEKLKSTVKSAVKASETEKVERNAPSLTREIVAVEANDDRQDDVSVPGSDRAFQLAHLTLGMPLAQARKELDRQSPNPLLYSRRYRLLTAGTDDCVAEFRSRRDALTNVDQSCVHATFDATREHRADRIDVTQVLRGDTVHEMIDELVHRFGTPTHRVKRSPDPRFTEAGFGNVIELRWSARELTDSDAQQTMVAQLSASNTRTRMILTLSYQAGRPSQQSSHFRD